MPLPPQIAELARTRELGSCWLALPPRLRRGRLLLTVFGLVMVAFAIGIVLDPGVGSLRFYLATIVGPLSLAGLAVLFSLGRISADRATWGGTCVFDNGFIVVNRRGPAAYRWDEIVRLYLSVPPLDKDFDTFVDSITCRLVLADGRQVRLAGYAADTEMLGPLLRSEVTRVQLVRAREALRRGEQVQFGPFDVRTEGIGKGGDVYDWSEISGIRAAGNSVYLVRHGGGDLRVDREVVPNLNCLLLLVQELGAAHGIDRSAHIRATLPDLTELTRQTPEWHTPIPPAIERQAAAAGLGEYRETCTADAPPLWLRRAGLVAIGAAYIATFNWGWDYTFDDSSAVPFPLRALIAAVGGGFTAYAFSRILPWSRRAWARLRGRELLVYEYGFVLMRRGDTTVARWRDVTDLFVHLTQWAAPYSVRIDLTGDRSLTIRTFAAQQRRLTALIEAEVSPAKAQQAIQSIVDGRTVSFGQFRLSVESLTSAGRRVAWTDVATVDLVGPVVRIGCPGGALALPVVPAGSIPNLTSFLAAARQLAAAPDAY